MRFQEWCTPRMRIVGEGLKDLTTAVNICRLQNIHVGYPEQRTRFDNNPIYPETPLNLDLKHLWRYRRVPLTQALVNSFIYKYCYVLDVEENCLGQGWRQKRAMRKMLTRQFLPWIRDNLVDCLDETCWPLEMILFEALDNLLADKFP